MLAVLDKIEIALGRLAGPVHTDPRRRRRAHNLAAWLLLSTIAATAFFVIDLIGLIAAPSREWAVYLGMETGFLMLLTAAWRLLRRDHASAAGALFLTLVIAALSFGLGIDTVDQAFIGYGIACLAASYLVGPVWAVPAAGLSIACYTAAWLLAGAGAPSYNILSVVALAIAAPLFWLAAGQLDRALGAEAALRHELERDVAARRDAEMALRTALGELRELADIVDRSPAVAIVWSPQEGYPVEFVSAGIRQFGYEPEDLRSGKPTWTDLVHPDDRQRMQEEIETHLKDGADRYSQEYRIRTAAGVERWIDDRTWVRRDAAGDIVSFLGILLDASERHDAQEELRALSLRDELTGLYNRRALLEVAPAQLLAAHRSGTPTSLVYLDLDGMKHINDTYGHEEGDAALAETAALLTKALRQSDVIARIGGDEFVVLMTGVDGLGARSALARLRRALQERNRAAVQYSLQLSYGLAVSNADAPLELDELLRAADQDMYRHKRRRSGRGMQMAG